MTASNDRPESGETRVALVTGGSRGIGLAVCEQLLEAGWTVFLCSKSESAVAAALTRLEAHHPGCVFARTCDVREQNQVEQTVAWVLEQAGRIDCLVNNAGLGIFGSVETISPEDWHLVLRTNLDGAFYAIHAAAPAMKEQGEGWIINIASLASRNPFPGGAAYNASKFGLLGLSDASMLDLRPHGIRVAAILPGSVDTDFSNSGQDESWKLTSDDVARSVMDLLAYPGRALPSRLELRPSSPPR
jgi:NAD(P)-dependent dehydrogenase (short-subunit alcohol dehydrogenase family)